MATNQIKVDLIGKDKSMSRSMRTAGSNIDRLGKKMQSAGRAMTLGLTLPIVAGAALAVKAASDLNESMNKSNVVFGKSAKAVHKWSKTSATSLGLSRQAAEDSAGTLGNLFITMGLGEKQTADMSIKITNLASDLASFNNIPIEEALTSLRSGLVGEAEPMRRLGVLLSEAAVKTEAYRLKLAKSGDELTEQQKVMARYSLIMKQTKKAQGDFARTSDGLANKSKILKAQFIDIAAKLGEELLPIVQDVAGYVSGLLDRFGELTQGQRSAIVKIGLVVAAMGPLLYITGKVLTSVSSLATAYKRVAKWAGLAATAGGKVGAGTAAGTAAGSAGGAGAGAVTGASMGAMATAAGGIAIMAATPLVMAAIADKVAPRSGTSAGALGARGSASDAFRAKAAKVKISADTSEYDKEIEKAEKKWERLREKLMERIASGEYDNEDLIEKVAKASDRIAKLKKQAEHPIEAGHIANAKWMNAIEESRKKHAYFKSLVQDPITAAHINDSGWLNPIANARSQYALMKSYIENTPISSHMTVYKNTVSGHKPPDSAEGGVFSGRQLRYVGEAGPEAIVPLTKPRRAAEVMQEAGLSGGPVTVNVVMPTGSTIIGMAADVGNALAPHVASALRREKARAGRRR